MQLHEGLVALLAGKNILNNGYQIMRLNFVHL